MARTPIEIMIDKACGFDGSSSVPIPKNEMPETMPDMLLAVADAAKEWWRGKRPISYTRKKHLNNPTINTVGEAEKKLAEAVVSWIKIGG